MTNEQWDDERLDAAYVARGVANPTPDDLTASTIAFVRAAAGHDRSSRSPRRLAIAAMIAVVVGGVGLAIVSFPKPASPGAATTSGPTPAATSESPAASGSPSSSAPTVVAGLPVVSVSDAIAVRDGGQDGREIAVHGWFAWAALACPAPIGQETPLQLSCEDSYKWLTEDQQPPSTSDPSVPFIRPLMDPEAIGASLSADVVVVGHFDDRRSALCEANERQGCEDRFVVDRICWVDGTELPISDVNQMDGPRASTPDDIHRVIEAAAPDWPVLSSMTVPGSRLSAIEPTLASRDEFGLTQERAVWVVRVVVNGKPATYLVVDGTLEAYMIAADGRAQQARKFSPGVRLTDPWPPEGASIVFLPGVDVAVLDASGRLLLVHEGALDPTSLGGDLGHKPVKLVSTAVPEEVLLTWSGSGCDRRATVTIDAGLRSIAVQRVEAQACEGDARTYGLILRFDGPVDVSAIRVSAPPPTTGPLVDPSATRISVEVASEKGAAVSLVVVDVTGSLVDARSATPDELEAPSESRADSPLDVVNLAGRSDTLLVRWAGSPCDLPSEMRITNRTAPTYAGNPILPPTDLTLLPRSTLCDGLDVGRRGLVLQFSVDVNPGAIQGRTVVGSLGAP